MSPQLTEALKEQRKLYDEVRLRLPAGRQELTLDTNTMTFNF